MKSPRRATPGLHHCRQREEVMTVSRLLRHCRRVRCPRRSRSARGCARRCSDAVEHQRHYRDPRLGTDLARLHAELRDGPGRRLRRRQRNRPRLSALSRHATRQSVGLERCCGRDCCVPRSRGRRSFLSDGRAREPGDAVRCRARCDSRRAREGRRDRRRRSSRQRDARRPNERRPQSHHAVPIRVRHHPGRLARVAAAHCTRPNTLGGKREAVPRAERRDAPHQGPEQAHEQGVCP